MSSGEKGIPSEYLKFPAFFISITNYPTREHFLERRNLADCEAANLAGHLQETLRIFRSTYLLRVPI